MLAAAARSDGDTTAMTYELRVGTSICDNALRISSSAITQVKSGISGINTRITLEGRCVKTMVLISPKRLAMRTASRYENAVKTPVQKKIAAAVPTDNWNFSNIHSASIDCTMKPPPKASRLNRAART